MVKRKLKGKNVERLKPKQKAKMEKTLKRMDNAREQDNVILRKAIEEKIRFSHGEIKKADEHITLLKQKIQETFNMKIRNEGAILSLGEILKNDTQGNN